MDRVITRAAELNCTADQAFELFSNHFYLSKWLAKDARVTPELGGAFELFWSSFKSDSTGSVGCKILVFQPAKLLAFEWKGPKQFNHFMNFRRPLTQVFVSFFTEKSKTKILLCHTGWGKSEEWDEAYYWTESVWKVAFSALNQLAATEFTRKSPVLDFSFNLVYVDKIEPALAFYTKYLGFVKESVMEDGSCLGKAGPVTLWIGPNFQKSKVNEDSVRTSIMYHIDSIFPLFQSLKSEGVKTIQDTPIEMKNGQFWFQFIDPAGNILEALGER
jgi:uncharacterized protein YndB with AHSA1/START domain/predicted enzyme related to lactoylglutathione lyase